uniref:Uncharacterized protein n=1 Tax=Anguilla anguilla TaxID=7936 RepID=A0A0E9VEU3_ANGAN
MCPKCFSGEDFCELHMLCAVAYFECNFFLQLDA